MYHAQDGACPRPSGWPDMCTQSRMTYRPAALAPSTAVERVVNAVSFHAASVGWNMSQNRTRRTAVKPLALIESYVDWPQVSVLFASQIGWTFGPISLCTVPE